MERPAGFDPYSELFGLLNLPPEEARMRQVRRKLIWAFSWAIPSREAVQVIASYSPLLEVGAGSGYWAWLLRQAGADVVALDRDPAAPPRWSEVSSGGPESVPEHPTRTLLLCWPPLGEPFAADCLKLYRGEILLSIGEKNDDARTGDAHFREMLRDRFEEIREVPLPCWPGFCDCLTVYLRKS